LISWSADAYSNIQALLADGFRKFRDMAQNPDNQSLRSDDILKLTAEIVAAYVSNNSMSASELPSIIKSVHSTLSGLGGAFQNEVQTSQKPAVPVKRSVNPDYIVCLEDGKKLKMLKRYLRSNYNLTPEEYRAKWGLPADYPMVAPNYAAQRSEFAKKIGLGRTASSSGRRRKG
jgi:predicted transcriptional regulator